ncbi:MAG: hypothetical protein KDA74_25495, partial [Planctomycetaceae bacterium]|nr:hypothetical protein [Planctomycetaceae bacterium]
MKPVLSCVQHALFMTLLFSCLSHNSPLLHAQDSAKPDSAAKPDQPLYEFTFIDAQQQTHTIQAAQVLEAQDGGVVMLTRDGRLLTATPEQLKQKRQLDQRFTPLTHAELEQELTAEFGPDFTITHTKHFTICSQAGKRYSKWCSYLFERLFSVLHYFWYFIDFLLLVLDV